MEESDRSTTNKTYWVGVIKDKWDKHRVFEFEGEPEPKDVPDCNYVIGPYATKEEAESRARIETNKTGMFTDPFGPQPYGR